MKGNKVEVEVTSVRWASYARLVARTARAYLEKLELSGVELSVALVGDRKIRTLNRQWRRKDKATDVLSFPAGKLPKPWPFALPLGDVIVSVDTARRVARQLGVPIEDELKRYLAHGLLHLLGHDHHSVAEARRMSREENRLLGGQGMVSMSWAAEKGA